MQALKTLREQAALSQNGLARKAGIAQSSISAIESGKTIGPRLDTLVAVAKVLGCTVDDIISDGPA